MNEMRVFSYGEKQVRTMLIGEATWRALVDVCRAISLTTPSRVAERLGPDEKMTLRLVKGQVGVRGGAPRLIFVSESGLQSILARSNKPEAKKFKRWVTREMVAAARKTAADEPQPSAPSSVVPVATPVVPELPMQERISRAGLLIRAAEHPAIPQDEQVRLLNIAVLDLTGMGVKVPRPGEAFQREAV